MSDSHDQSYYEIALTNRQVLSIFVGLLVCMLVSFLGGVWLGQNADQSVKVASTQAIVAADGTDAPLERLDFFSRSEAANGPSARTDDAPEQAPEPASAGKQPAASSPAASGEAPGKGAPQAPNQAARRPKAEPVVVATQDSIVIQVFSSNEEAQARRVVDQLRARGYPALLSPVDVSGRTLHRVRIGPYTDRDEAEVVAESVRRAFDFETWITN